MKEKLTQMLKKQKKLDERILKGKPYPVDKMKIALFVEIGEFLNEVPTIFKHWKTTAKDDKEKALEELVDCWHFLISLRLTDEITISNLSKLIETDYDKSLCVIKDNVYLPHLIVNICENLSFEDFFTLMNYFEFSFDQLYTGYLSKNKINHERQDNNY